MDMEERPVRQSRLFRVIVAAGTVLLLLAFVILRYEGFFAVLRSILRAMRPLLLGVLFASMLNPAYDRLRTDFSLFAERHGKNPAAGWIPPAAAFGAALPPVLILFSLICVLIPQLRESAELLTGDFGTYSGNFLRLVQNLPQLARLTGISEARISELLDSVQAGIPALLRKTYDYTAELIRWLLDIGIGAVFSLYLLTDKHRLRRQLLTAMRCTRQKSAARRGAQG